MKAKPLMRSQLSSITAGNKVIWKVAKQCHPSFSALEIVIFSLKVLSGLCNRFITAIFKLM